MENTEKRKVPFKTIIEMVRDFIFRLGQQKNMRIWFAWVGFFLGTLFIVGTLSAIPFEKLGAPGATLIGVGSMFYGTVCFGLIQGIIDRKDKIQNVKIVEKRLEELANSEDQEDYSKFEKKFLDALENIFKG